MQAHHSINQYRERSESVTHLAILLSLFVSQKRHSRKMVHTSSTQVGPFPHTCVRRMSETIRRLGVIWDLKAVLNYEAVLNDKRAWAISNL